MPSLVVANPAFTQSGIALTASSCIEQVNGLVEVQATYTIAANRQSQLDAQFYVDAPPPIHPSCIAKSNLLTNRLYMMQRSVSTSNGFCTVNAQYVGGLVRAGFVGYYLTEQLDQTVLDVITSDTPIFVLPGTSAGVIGTRVRHEKYEISVEFVKVGGAFAVNLPTISRGDLARNWRATKPSGLGQGETATAMPVFSGLPYDQLVLGRLPLAVEESRDYQTPTVNVTKLKYRLD